MGKQRGIAYLSLGVFVNHKYNYIVTDPHINDISRHFTPKLIKYLRRRYFVPSKVLRKNSREIMWSVVMYTFEGIFYTQRGPAYGSSSSGRGGDVALHLKSLEAKWRDLIGL